MEITDLEYLQPTPSNWFSPNIEYKGVGRAEFEKPIFTMIGDAIATFNEFGEYEILLKVEKAIDADGLIRSYFDFLHLLGGTNENKISKLEIETDNGKLIAKDDLQISYKYSAAINDPDKSGLYLSFFFKTALFNKLANSMPKYWVLPISNFISDFYQSVPGLSNHPLRIFPNSKVPDDVPVQIKEQAQFISNQMNRLIVFEFNHENGFIEPLEDYEERKNKLVKGKVRNLLTAIMVGNVLGFPSENWEELTTWFPIDFLHLLGLATGSEVGATYIEIRDENGELIRRIHVDLGTPTYIKGHRAIDEISHRGTGVLLSNSVKSEHWRKPHTRVLLRHIVRGGFQRETMLEDRFLYLCRGFENLAKYFDLQSEDLMQNLSPNTIEKINEVINTAKFELLNYAKKGNLGISEKSAMMRISNRVISSKERDLAFGSKVYKLLEKFQLPDAQILDEFFKNNPREDNIESWGDILSIYRGSAIHEGFFDISPKRLARLDIFKVMNHLHDLLLRITFLMLDYQGNYDPTMSKFHSSKPIRWVTQDTSANELGY